MKPARFACLILAVGALPFGLGPWNGARVIGVILIIAFIILTIVGAPKGAKR